MYPAALRAQEVRTITAQVEAAIAARPETPAHNALISALQHLDETSQVDSILKGAGVALKRLADDRKLHSADIDANLARNAAEAWGLGPGVQRNTRLFDRAPAPASFSNLAAVTTTHRQRAGRALTATPRRRVDSVGRGWNGLRTSGAVGRGFGEHLQGMLSRAE
jgi:hypothetical protein